MSDVLAFWTVSLVVGLVTLPIAFALLRRLPDAGAGLSLGLGLVLAGYGYFILRVLHLLPAGRGGYLIALVLLALVAAAVAGRDRRFLSTFRRTWTAWVAAAGLFTFLFFAYVAFRSYNPEITGTEQPMDFMYLNATLSSPDYPPDDPWLSGERASYYYFGYLQMGVLTAASGVAPSLGYNLGLAYTFAAAGTAVASLGYALARWAIGSRGRRWAIAAGALAVVLLLFVGSLSAVFELAAAHGQYNDGLYGKLGVEWLIPCEPGQTERCFSGDVVHRGDHWYPQEYWFWWRGSRVIPNTITEFPFFSFLLGDLHPHVMSIPLALLSIAVSASVWRGRRLLSWRTHRRQPALGIALGLIFGALAFQNAWDILTFSAILALAVAARNLRRLPFWRACLRSATFLAPVGVVAVVAYVPWYGDFSSQASGLAPYVGTGTRPAHAFLQFGPLLAAALLALAWAFRRGHRERTFNAAVLALWVPMIPFALWLALARYNGDLRDGLDARSAGGWVTLVAYGAATWGLVTAALVMRGTSNAGAMIAALGAVGAFLLYGSELFLIKDIFFGGAPRLNTVFKLSYQAWLLLSVAGAAALAVALQKAWRHRALAGWLALPAGLVVAAGLVYPVTALPNRTEGFTKDAHLDGLQFLAQNQPSEYPLLRWVQEYTPPGATVIEASGRLWRLDDRGLPVIVDAGVDYTDAARVSARTGRPALLGWFFHEIQWRGDTLQNREEFTRRQAAIDSVYTQKDPAAVLETLRRAGADYVVVGRLEKEKYPAQTMAPFEQFLDVAFEADGYRVYRVPRYAAVETS